MSQYVLTKFPWPVLPSIALVLFFGFFVILIGIVSARSRRPIYDQASLLPLEDGLAILNHSTHSSKTQETKRG